MSWLRRLNPGFTASQPSSNDMLTSSNSEAVLLLDAFRSHWLQASGIMRYHCSNSMSATIDEVTEVFKHMDQLNFLLLAENSGQEIGPVLDFVFAENVYEHFVQWCLSPQMAEFSEICKLESLKLFENLISQSHHFLLVHKPVLNPLLDLLDASNKFASVEVEKRLVVVLNQVCTNISHDATLLEFFFNKTADDGPPKFSVFSMLIGYLYREGNIGQMARDALLLLLTFSRELEYVGLFIAHQSSFCPVVATGVSGLYSLLPRKLNIYSDDWHRITAEDVEFIPCLRDVFSALEFCNAVVQVGHLSVQEQLLDYLYQGFLIPVMSSALLQNSNDELIAATAYFELFLRLITEPELMRVFVRFLLFEKSDGVALLETLITRISSSSTLCLVSLSLFQTLLNLNCEDLMYELIFKYLIPCTHVMADQLSLITQIDLFGQSSSRFLELVPVCCVAARQIYAAELTSEFVAVENGLSKSGNNDSLFSRAYQWHYGPPGIEPANDAAEYFTGASPRHFSSWSDSLVLAYVGAVAGPMLSCRRACKCWALPYDGELPTPLLLHEDSNRPPANAKQQLSDANAPNQLPKTNSYFGVRHSSALNSSSGEASLADLRLGYRSIFAPPIPDASTQVDDSHNDSPLSGDNEKPSSADSSAFSTPRYAMRTSTEAVPADYFKLAFDEDALALSANDSAVPDDVDSAVPNSPGPNFQGWSQIQDVDTFMQVLERVPPLRSAAKSSIDDHMAYFDRMYEAICGAANADRQTDKSTSGGHAETMVTDSADRAIRSELLDNVAGICQNGDRSTDVHVDAQTDTRKLSAHITEISCADFGPQTLHRNILRNNSETPNIGPFLNVLFHKLENVPYNSLYVNLQLTAVISRLACYPQPLLASFLLNGDLMLRPNVRSLTQILGSVRRRIDAYAKSVANFELYWLRGQQFLQSRGRLQAENSRGGRRRSMIDDDASTIISADQHSMHSDDTSILTAKRNRGLSNLFRQASKGHAANENSSGGPRSRTMSMDASGAGLAEHKPRASTLLPVEDHFGGNRQIAEQESMKIKNTVYGAIVLEEFVKELAAISLERAIL